METETTDDSLTASYSVRPATQFRWVICALLFFATTINYVDRQILSLLKPMLDGQFHWSSTTFGLINSAFQASYGISLLVFGRLIDRFGTKRGYAMSIAAWSTAAIGHALVGSVSGFFVARVALGLSEGGNFPAAIKATAQWFPRTERALATSLFNSGANIGAVIAPAIIPPIAAVLGWQWAFVFAGIAGYIWLLVWWPIFGPPEQSSRVSTSELAHIRADTDVINASTNIGAVTWGSVLKHRQAWAYIAAKFFTDPVWWFFLIWLPDFFKQTRHLDIKRSAPLLITIYGIVTVLSIAGGWLSGHLVARGWSITKARKVSLLLFALVVTPIIFAPSVSNWAAVGLIGLAGAAHQAWSATLYTTVSDIFPAKAVATLVGVGSAAGSLGGMIFPILTGVILDHFANGYTLLFAACSAAYLLAFAVQHLLAPSFASLPADEVVEHE